MKTTLIALVLLLSLAAGGAGTALAQGAPLGSSSWTTNR